MEAYPSEPPTASRGTICCDNAISAFVLVSFVLMRCACVLKSAVFVWRCVQFSLPLQPKSEVARMVIWNVDRFGLLATTVKNAKR